MRNLKSTSANIAAIKSGEGLTMFIRQITSRVVMNALRSCRKVRELNQWAARNPELTDQGITQGDVLFDKADRRGKTIEFDKCQCGGEKFKLSDKCINCTDKDFRALDLEKNFKKYLKGEAVEECPRCGDTKTADQERCGRCEYELREQ